MVNSRWLLFSIQAFQYFILQSKMRVKLIKTGILLTLTMDYRPSTMDVNSYLNS